MNRFQALLEPLPNSTPKEDQERASRGLKAVVSSSKLNWWTESASAHSGRFLILVVAPYSQYDLALLDLVDERLREYAPPKVDRVYVSNLLDEDKKNEIADYVASIKAHQTPIAILVDAKAQQKCVWGKEARDLTADAIGVRPEELTGTMLARCKRYTGPHRG